MTSGEINEKLNEVDDKLAKLKKMFAIYEICKSPDYATSIRNAISEMQKDIQSLSKNISAC